jgi:clan AA aspartic protease
MDKKTTSSGEALRQPGDSSKMRFISHSNRLVSVGSPEDLTLVGEVRVHVKLTKAGDEVLVRRGLLSPEKVRTYDAEALVDTGAARSVLPLHVAQELGLATVRQDRATFANDVSELVDISEVVGILINTRRTTEEMFVLGSEVLIGQTVLESLDLFVDCLRGRVVGNPAHPDQPMIKIKTTLTISGRRTTPCASRQ